MNETFLFIGSCLFAFLLWFCNKKLADKQVHLPRKVVLEAPLFVRRALSVLLFVLYMPVLFSLEQISNQMGLGGYVYSPVATVFLLLLKWLTYFSVAVVILLPFFDKKEVDDYCTFVLPVVVLLNCIFLRPIIVSIVGSVSLYHWQTIMYVINIALMGAIGGERLIRFITCKDFADIRKRLARLAVYFVTYIFAYMPIYTLQLFFGDVGDTVKGFNLVHRLVIYFTFAFPLAMYFVFRKKDKKEKYYFLLMLCISGFMQYFVWNGHRSGLTSFPLHLCNTAIALMLFAYAFKLHGVFYFTYLVNVLGAIFALLMPNCTEAATNAGTLLFYYNHCYAIFLPILGVALKVFDRPNIKLVGKAIIAFTVYWFVAATLNGWLNNSPINVNHEEIDYFFLYSDFFIEKFSWAFPLKYDYVLRFRLGNTNMTYFYVYNLCIYVIFVAFMFVTWGAYGAIYKVEDAYAELSRRKKLMAVDRVNLLKELDGRSPSEPLHPEGGNMIKISHFSKTYAGSTLKAVDDLNLEVHAGEVFGFIGHNGAGKSTTIKSMVGMQSITDGSIEIEGYDIARQPLEAKLNIGYVSDNHAVYEQLTGREYIGYVADLYMVSKEDKEARIAKYADMFGLTNALDREIKSYSHGMKQKIMVISALIHNPKVWVLDEPLTGLDPTSAFQIKECMRMHASEGNIVFFSSHVIEVVEKICDRIAIISGGKLRRVTTMKELKQEGVPLEQLYLQYQQGKDNTTEGAKQTQQSDEKELSSEELSKQYYQAKNEAINPTATQNEDADSINEECDLKEAAADTADDTAK